MDGKFRRAGTARRDLAGSPIGEPAYVVGADGKQYPATKPKPKPSPSIFVTTAKEQERAAQALQRLKDAAPAKFLDLDRAECLARERANGGLATKQCGGTSQVLHLQHLSPSPAPTQVSQMRHLPYSTAPLISQSLLDVLRYLPKFGFHTGGYFLIPKRCTCCI